MFQEAGIAVIVLGRDDRKGIGAIHFGRKLRMLDGFPGIVDRKRQRTDINELGLDPGPLCEFSAH